MRDEFACACASRRTRTDKSFSCRGKIRKATHIKDEDVNEPSTGDPNFHITHTHTHARTTDTSSCFRNYMHKMFAPVMYIRVNGQPDAHKTSKALAASSTSLSLAQSRRTYVPSSLTSSGLDKPAGRPVGRNGKTHYLIRPTTTEGKYYRSSCALVSCDPGTCMRAVVTCDRQRDESPESTQCAFRLSRSRTRRN